MIRGIKAVASVFILVLPALMFAGCHSYHHRHSPRYGFGYYDDYYGYYNYGHYNYSRSHAPSRPPEPRRLPKRPGPGPGQIRPAHPERPEPGRMRPDRSGQLRPGGSERSAADRTRVERPVRSGGVQARPERPSQSVTGGAQPGRPPASKSENRSRVRPAQTGRSAQVEEPRLITPGQTRPVGQSRPRRK